MPPECNTRCKKDAGLSEYSPQTCSNVAFCGKSCRFPNLTKRLYQDEIVIISGALLVHVLVDATFKSL